MQQIQISNRVFLGVAERILSIRNSNTIDDFIFSILNHSKLKNWHSDNNVRLRTLTDKIQKLRKEYFVFETIEGKEEEQLKMFTPDPIPAVSAKYETKIISKNFLWKKGITEQILISPEIPAKTFEERPVCNEGKTLEKYNEKYNTLMEEQNTMIF